MSEPTWRIRARELGKDFVVQRGQLTAFHLARRIFGNGAGGSEVLTALDGVDLEVDAGDVMGVIGSNGAGKTTLLKVVAGLYAPSRGTVAVRGRLSLLSGLGVGMLGDLRVDENVHLYGAICGMSRARLAQRFDEIIGWAELEEFVHAPLRHLSTGMRTRLAFAVAMQVEADVLLLDEALSAGDERFRKKCEAYFASHRGGDTAVLISSHDLEFVERHCTRALWLRPGEPAVAGAPGDVVPRYRVASG